MKKSIKNKAKCLTALLSVSLSFCAVQAQLVVKPNGNVGIGTSSTANITSKLKVEPKTPRYSLVDFTADSCSVGLNISRHLSVSNSEFKGLILDCEVFPNASTYGIYACLLRANAIGTGRAYGVYSFAGRATNGYNYGVCTSLLCENDGTGLYASSGNNPTGVLIPGRYAGYFDGNVEVAGTLHATTITSGSDYRLKRDIRNLEGSSLDRLMDMNVVQFKLKQLELDMGDTAKTIHYKYEPDSPILKKDHFGLIAQELREIYPDLVYEGGDGYLSVNYIELIPLLIKSVQELNAKVEELENTADRTATRGGLNNGQTGISSSALETTALFQNNPNPFTENTVIECVISSDVKNATLYIYDMNGRQIDSIPIENRGRVSLTIQGNSLDAGIYMYSLITDGMVVDTKRMILTK